MPQKEAGGNLEALAYAHFKREFSPAERKLLSAAAKGETAYCGPKDPADPANDPSSASSWGPERQIEASLIRWLCVDKKAREQIIPAGIGVQGVKVVGELDLSYVTAPFSLYIEKCAFADKISLGDAELVDFSLEGSWIGSLNAQSLAVKVDVFLRGVYSNGGANLYGARIGGNLECSGSTFSNPGDYALNLEGIDVKGKIFLDGFRADGQVNLVGADMGDNLECDGGIFNNPVGVALRLEHAKVAGNVFLRSGFVAHGEVDLSGARIQGDLNSTGANFNDAVLNLTDASVSGIRDDRNGWPGPGKLILDGFVYGRIADGPSEAGPRLDWLALQPQKTFATQPYLQLAKVLKAAGDEDGAATVLEAMEDKRRSYAVSGHVLDAVEKWPLKLTVGYGYRPLRAFGWGVGLSVVGWIIYRRAELARAMVPTDKDACDAFQARKEMPPQQPRFSPAVYSIENSLPLVKLGQADKWQPDPDPTKRSARLLRWFLWAQILLGWLLATLFIAGVSGIVHKD